MRGSRRLISHNVAGMPEITRPSGVRLTTSGALNVSESAEVPPSRRRGRSGRLFGPTPLPSAGGDASTNTERADLLAAFADQEMTIVDEVELEPVPVVPGTTRGRAVGAETATLEV